MDSIIEQNKTEQNINIQEDLRILNAIGKKEGLIFDRTFKYYIGDSYKNNKGEYLKRFFEYKNKKYELKYFSGCFNPYLVICEVLK